MLINQMVFSTVNGVQRWRGVLQPRFGEWNNAKRFDEGQNYAAAKWDYDLVPYEESARPKAELVLRLAGPARF